MNDTNRAVEAEPYDWWGALKHGGMLIAPTRLPAHLPAAEDVPRLRWRTAEDLRRAVTRMLDQPDADALSQLLGAVLEDVVGLEEERWFKGSAVSASWGHESLSGALVKPRRLWKGPHETVLPLFVANGTLGDRSGEMVSRIGVGHGRRSVSRVVGWLRSADLPLALLTNGRQWRLVHAGIDYHAWCEWDADLWFEEGEPGLQVTALRALLSPESIVPDEEGGRSALMEAIRASRRGQAELSSVLGERVRQAVELVIGAFGPQLAELDEADEGSAPRKAMYTAATRVIMRCVVILFAEARGDELLPRSNPAYIDSYSLQGLREYLDRQVGGHGEMRLRHQDGAWPRMLALFRLIYEGSGHAELPMVEYGGQLFRPGDPTSDDAVLRALAVFEDPTHGPNDYLVQRLLTLLTRSRVKVHMGTGRTWVEAPVDFSDLSTQYIGILYEGLLDFELRRAPADDAMLFLNVGDQPALPLSRLAEMSDKRLSSLLDDLKGSGSAIDEEAAEAVEEDLEDLLRGSDEDDADEDADGEDDGDDDDDDGDAAEDRGIDPDDDLARQWSDRVQAWAERAVVAAKIVKKPRGKKTDAKREAFRRDVAETAEKLIGRVILPGHWFLVRWGGTRKGSGTFYTRPELAGPTTTRTLRPLAYEPVARETDPDTGLEWVTEWRPRSPEEILAVNVCDPAMGSGSFLVAALRFLTDALLESLFEHGRIAQHGEGSVIRLADGMADDDPANETLPVPPESPDFEDRLRARLKRHVVERCIYGVDIDGLAVELAKLALWIETMDRSLPFGFLDHKLRVGNSLVGCWLDRVTEYPVMAWERDGGDQNHSNFVHHWHDYEITRGKNKGKTKQRGDVWTRTIKDMRKTVIKDEMVAWINARREDAFEFMREGFTVDRIHDGALEALERVHDIPVHEADRKRELWLELVERDEQVADLREALDRWCAIWFWPGDELDHVPTPKTFQDPPDATRRIARDVARERKFLHWDLEFPDVFTGPESGFDAIIGNPPWETLQPNSKEYFSNIDPLYRSYGKQQALKRQEELFEQRPQVESDWVAYNAYYAGIANWYKQVGFPWGDYEDEEKGGDRFPLTHSVKETKSLHRAWRQRREDNEAFADPEHPFRHQGSGKAYTYKMFLESSYRLLGDRGRLGLIVPSGIYTDHGTADLRELFLDEARWEWLFGFENRRKIFDIDSRFKFGPLIAAKGGRTEVIRAAFMHHDLDDWADADEHVVAYPRSRVREFSPNSLALLEVRSARDLDILNKLYDNGVLLGDDGPDGWGIEYRQGDFNMTSDSHLFPPRPEWESKGYRGDEYGHWLKGRWSEWDGPTGVTSILERPAGTVLSQDGRWIIDVNDVEDVALPLEQGGMLHQYDFSQRAWISGSGLQAKWEYTNWANKRVSPQFLMHLEDASKDSSVLQFKPSIRRIARNTDTRMMIAGLVPRWPCADVASVLEPKPGWRAPALPTVLNSFACDHIVRVRCGGTHVDYHYIAEVPLPFPPTRRTDPQVLLGSRLGAAHPVFAPVWHTVHRTNKPWPALWALTEHERSRLIAKANAIASSRYSLYVSDLLHILDDTDHPVANSMSRSFTGRLRPTGFWRVDKDKDPELRHTVLALVAFADLQKHIDDAGGDREAGIASFCSQNDGEGWMLPETVRLADYGLGHDDRAKEHQPVRERFGERFLPWQLELSVEESWAACRRHAENIQQIVPWTEPATGEIAGHVGAHDERRVAESESEYGTGDSQMSLFSEQDHD